VDHSLSLKPEAANSLYRALGGRDRRKRAKKLAEMFSEDAEAIDKIKKLCESRKVTCEESLWVDGVW
jgi:hypothetical protein